MREELNSIENKFHETQNRLIEKELQEQQKKKMIKGMAKAASATTLRGKDQQEVDFSSPTRHTSEASVSQ